MHTQYCDCQVLLVNAIFGSSYMHANQEVLTSTDIRWHTQVMCYIHTLIIWELVEAIVDKLYLVYLSTISRINLTTCDVAN